MDKLKIGFRINSLRDATRTHILNYREAQIKFMMMFDRGLHRSGQSIGYGWRLGFAYATRFSEERLRQRMLVRSILTFDLSFGINSCES